MYFFLGKSIKLNKHELADVDMSTEMEFPDRQKGTKLCMYLIN